MAKQRISLLIPALIFVAVLPGASALLFYNVTGDPTMQPLAITFSKLAERNSNGDAAGIVVEVEWGANARSSNTRHQVQQTLEKAMSVYGIDYLVRIEDTTDDKISIFFVTASGRMGPYRLSNVASGISPAIAAYRLSDRSEPTN